mmetsp:Transcript_11698/g.36514  ORF Transcript_11698/g.36514 Transcript_11698/m.36514 type:complete len:368 (-) Transcript_11698:75-1178(-)
MKLLHWDILGICWLLQVCAAVGLPGVITDLRAGKPTSWQDGGGLGDASSLAQVLARIHQGVAASQMSPVAAEKWPAFQQLWDKITEAVKTLNRQQAEFTDGTDLPYISAEKITSALNEALDILRAEAGNFLNNTLAAKRQLLFRLKAKHAKAAGTDTSAAMDLKTITMGAMPFLDRFMPLLENIDAVFRSFNSIMSRALDAAGRPEFVATVNSTLDEALASMDSILLSTKSSSEKLLATSPDTDLSELNATLEDSAEHAAVFSTKLEKAFQDLADAIQQVIEERSPSQSMEKVNLAFGNTMQKVRDIAWTVHSGVREVNSGISKAAEAIVAQKKHYEQKGRGRPAAHLGPVVVAVALAAVLTAGTSP